MKPWAAVLVGVFFPIVWGLGSAWIFDKIRERRAQPAENEGQSQ